LKKHTNILDDLAASIIMGRLPCASALVVKKERSSATSAHFYQDKPCHKSGRNLPNI